ncbi:MAG: hypothetical protein V7776_17485 [Halopseudomonas aestusnigri]
MFRNTINWKKVGLFLKPETNKWWSLSHATIPTPEDLGGGVFRVYYAGRNEHNHSYISWADVDLNEPFQVLQYSKKPVLCPGKLGCFDDTGVTPSCIINLKNGEKALYYIGWNPGSTVRFHLFGGLATSNDGGETFHRYSHAPIIERSITDPYLNTAPWVVKVSEGYRMYYVSGTEWLHRDLPRYHIKIAHSHDGKSWQREGQVCIDFKDDSENALARPYVILDRGIWKMWFGYMGAKYRLGYAESYDGVVWVRRDDLSVINVSQSGFDADMIEYAAVVSHGGRHFMFYNGNYYGSDGIGLAVEE